MPLFDHIEEPSTGHRIEHRGSSLFVPDDPVIPFIEGDGVGPDIWQATRHILDAAVHIAYGGQKHIEWLEIYAGEKAYHTTYGEWLPQDTLNAIRHYVVAIKGPLTTPVGGGYRSLNVTLRQTLDLYACVRPVRYFEGVPTPVKRPEQVDMVIFRENTEDVYAGIEWKQGTPEAKQVIDYLNRSFDVDISEDTGIGVKPISIQRTKRLVRKAIQYAIDHGRDSVTLVHKGNIMKFTEGAFREWGYEVANEEFPDQTITEKELWDRYAGKPPTGKVIIKDRIADIMFQLALLRPAEFSVVATPNLNGDYLSDALAAQVGGIGMAPGANFGDHIGVFEATHGTAPKYAGQDKVNPGSLILSGVMMLEYLGWQAAADLIVRGLTKTIQEKRVTYDLERQMEGATLLKCSEFGAAIVENIIEGDG